MKKRLLCALLIMILVVTMLPQVTIQANAHKIVMTANEFIDCLWTAYSRPNYYYNSFPYNLGYYDGSRISFDCWNLGKAIIWTKGAIVNNYTVGKYATMDTSCGLGDWDGLTIVKEAPNCSSDFSNLVPGEWLYMDNHTGYYVGDGQVIECTAGWNVWAITVSQIDSSGRRSRNGVANGSWKLHGKVPWLDYTSAGVKETWIEQAAFDPVVYRGRYEDLRGKTDAQLKEHWLTFGIKEGRASSTVLDLKYYVENNPDLKQKYGTDYKAAYEHFIAYGHKEKRKFSPTFDGEYYCNQYPDAEQVYKKEYIKHYIDHGLKEGRRGSATFDVNYYLFLRPDVADTWPGDYAMAARHYAGYGIQEKRAGYDDQLPVISNAAISDISAEGYTVTCKVTDNWGVTKVAFPSWTVDNGQDDLADKFMDTQQGTKNGDTYTFRVKASDHNNAGGSYVTHIYAVDKGGNTAELKLDPVLVKDPSPEEIVLSPTSTYVKSGRLLKNVGKSTTTKNFLKQFENEELEVLDRNGNPIGSADLVGTGTRINLYDEGVMIDSLIVVVLGDVDGDGTVNTTDYMRIKSTFLGTFAMTEAEKVAADADGNGIIDNTDYMRIKSHLMGVFDLYE